MRMIRLALGMWLLGAGVAFAQFNIGTGGAMTL